MSTDIRGHEALLHHHCKFSLHPHPIPPSTFACPWSRFLLVDSNDPSWYKSIQLFTDNAVNPCLQSTYNFVAAVVEGLSQAHRDVMPLQTFHFGGDEVAKGAWENSSACDTLLTSGFDFRQFKDLKEYFVRQVGLLAGCGLVCRILSEL